MHFSKYSQVSYPNGKTNRMIRKRFILQYFSHFSKLSFIPQKHNLSLVIAQNSAEYYLKLPLGEKRGLYSCGKKFVEIDQVKSWTDYAGNIDGKVKRTANPLFDVDEELNMKISLWRGDITTLEIDVICNAANTSLLGGGGVDGVIHRSAGKKLLEECTKLNGCETGSAKLTGGYKLPAKYILHTVGPIGENPEALSSCYRTCLDLAKKHKLRTIAFPCISTGIYGYDVEKATPVVMEAVRDWLLSGNNSRSIDKIIFCVFLIKDVAVYEHNLLKYFPIDKPSTELPDKKKSKTKNETDEPKEQKELPEKKKPKTSDSTKNNTEEPKEQKELPEKKKPKTSDSTKNNTGEPKEQKELPEKKKPKTSDSTTSNTKEVKEQKDNKTEKQPKIQPAESKSDIEKKEKERNNPERDSVKENIQESHL
ncbi:ADP-ribose glycohydrolase MACROD1-like isoform X2 [Mercenaria mercenaria]|uniref:ADP-ribose glycohydrolase MACROD1-like isoform X2 n=1 Tax=Mercenaria mercenaria TaxID=6596 RepID=UPI00234EC283|nr:ADP-ribose glycohydrolase MACROD1-like isoform X2 [Mercenaria mercenaria]